MTTPPQPASHALVESYTPVPDSGRSDGWSAERQRAFLSTLADSGSIVQAAAAAGMATQSAYRLRRRAGAEAFARGWDAALVLAADNLVALAFERAVDGSPRGVWHKGERVGEERVVSDRLLMFLIAGLDKARFGRLSGIVPYVIEDSRAAARRDLPRLGERLADPDAPEPPPAPRRGRARA